MKLPNLKSGYSIVELIIYVAVFAVLTVVIANAFIVLVSFFSQTRTNHDLLDNGNTAMERISYEIRNSTSVLGTSVLGTSPGVLELDSVDDSNNPRVVRFEMSNGALNLSYDGTLVGNILGPNMVINSLIFTSAQTDNGDVVKIEMILQDTRDETLRIENFSNIVNIANIDPDAANSGSTVSLVYGVHVGSLASFTSGSTFIGDLYSVGPIYANLGTSTITGSVVSSGVSGYLGQGDYLPAGFIVGGNVSANSVSNTSATGTIYCQTGTSNNKTCDTSQPGPIVEPLPDLSAQISAWKSEAEAGGLWTTNRSLSASDPSPMGPWKVEGDLYIGSHPLVLSGPLWVTGDFTAINSDSRIRIDSSYGNSDEVIIVDGRINLGGGMQVSGSGSSGSHVFFVSTNSGQAMYIDSMSGNAVFYAPNGQASFSSGAKVKGIIAERFNVYGGSASALEYVPGPSSLNFGPSVFSVTP